MIWYTPSGEKVEIKMLGPSPFKRMAEHYFPQRRFVLCPVRDCPFCWLTQEVKLELREPMRWADDGGRVDD